MNIKRLLIILLICLLIPFGAKATSIDICWVNQPAELHYGDTVILKAIVDCPYDYYLYWECCKNGNWAKCGDGDTLSFVVTKENQDYAWRCVLVEIFPEAKEEEEIFEEEEEVVNEESEAEVLDLSASDPEGLGELVPKVQSEDCDSDILEQTKLL